MSADSEKRSEITGRREWDGGIPGEEVTITVPSTDRLRVLIGGAEISLQDDGQGHIEIIVSEGRIVLWACGKWGA